MEKPEAKSFKLLTISVEKLPASMGRQTKISEYATDRARLLLGCYRTGDANDPETYVAAIAATLARYSEEIITSVTHPVSGLPSKKSWLPTVKEVHDACEEIDEFEQRRNARERGIREQLEARRQEDIERQRPRPTLAELQAMYGKNWGMTTLDEKPGRRAYPSFEEIAASYSADPSRIARLMKISDDHREYSTPSTEEAAQ